MKKALFFLFILAVISTGAQESDITPAAKGVVYGAPPSEKGKPISVTELQSKLSNNMFEGQITGRVKEVCKSMGCWMTLEQPNGTALMVEMKDHAFFLPQDLTGRTVVIEGTAGLEDVTEKKRKHLAEDAGKSKDEIAKIIGSVKELQFSASGVKVID